jgi:HPt (histidine-containing phosphotransfer) domain-containing protein
VNIATSSILDIADLLTRVDDDHELLVELFFIFKSVFPAHLQGLADAINAGDAKKVQTEGHTLKGMLLNLAATRASAVALRLEEMGREKQLGGMKEALAAFQVEVELLLTQMEECVNGLQR